MSKWGLLFTTEVLFYDKKNKIELVVKNNENQSVPEQKYKNFKVIANRINFESILNQFSYKIWNFFYIL